ncbi:hypothetical protein NDU88_001504, partial [Pleurodeles waltl]
HSARAVSTRPTGRTSEHVLTDPHCVHVRSRPTTFPIWNCIYHSLTTFCIFTKEEMFLMTLLHPDKCIKLASVQCTTRDSPQTP